MEDREPLKTLEVGDKVRLTDDWTVTRIDIETLGCEISHKDAAGYVWTARVSIDGVQRVQSQGELLFELLKGLRQDDRDTFFRLLGKAEKK